MRLPKERTCTQEAGQFASASCSVSACAGVVAALDGAAVSLMSPDSPQRATPTTCENRMKIE
jgi:hypothetical protein